MVKKKNIYLHVPKWLTWLEHLRFLMNDVIAAWLRIHEAFVQRAAAAWCQFREDFVCTLLTDCEWCTCLPASIFKLSSCCVQCVLDWGRVRTWAQLWHQVFSWKTYYFISIIKTLPKENVSQASFCCGNIRIAHTHTQDQGVVCLHSEQHIRGSYFRYQDIWLAAWSNTQSGVSLDIV